VISYLQGGDAGQWASANQAMLLAATWDEFLGACNSCFQDPEEKKKARDKLYCLRVKDWDV